MDMMIDALWKDGLQTRVGIDERTVSEYAEAMRGGAVFPPVKVFEEPCAGAYYLADGFHRVEAAIRAGRKSVDAEVVRGTFTDALRYALGCNARHGKRLTNEDKRRSLEMAWESRSELFGGDPSASLLAQTCCVHRNTAQQFIEGVKSRQVAQDVQPERIPQPPRRIVGLDGKSYRTAKGHAAGVIVDRFGVEVPIQLNQAFKGGKIDEVLALISKARSLVKIEIERGNPEFTQAKEDRIVLHLSNAYRELSDSVRPYCVCRWCQGTGCRACGESGFQTKAQYNLNPPERKASK